jgi:hypothetical protein
MTQTTENPGLTPKATGILHGGLNLISSASDGLRWLSSPRSAGGATHVYKAMAIVLFGLSVETTYGAISATVGRDPSAYKFFPKAGIKDGAKLERIVPLPLPLILGTASTVYNFAGSTLPAENGFERWDYQPKATEMGKAWTDGYFYLAFVLSLAVNATQAHLTRPRSIRARKAALDRVRKYRIEDLSPKALDLARARQADLKRAGMGARYGVVVGVIGSYGVELGSFVTSLSGSTTPIAPGILWALLSMFGAEVSWNMDRSSEVEEEADVPTTGGEPNGNT